MTETLKAGIFQVTEVVGGENDGEPQSFANPPAFAETIQDIQQRSLDGRSRRIGKKWRRLENYRDESRLMLMTFATFSYPGPGIGSRATNVQSIRIAADQEFAYDTAALYDTKHGLMFLESGQSGITSGGIAEYVSKFTEPKAEFRLFPVLDSDAAKKVRQMVDIRSVIVQAAVGRGAEVDENIAVINAVGADYDAAIVQIEIRAARSGSTLDRSKIQKLVNSILKLKDAGTDRVKKLTAKGRQHADGETKVIDLLNPKESGKYEGLEVDPTTRQILYEDRWKALRSIHDEHIKNARLD